MSTIQELKDTILEVVRTEGDATFSRLEQLDGFSGGDRILGDSTKNVIIWDRMTDEAVTALMELQEEGSIQSRTTNFFIYAYDGGAMPSLPIAKKTPANGYKEPHWQPILLVPGVTR
jgi:hypothetical protein